MKVYLAVGHGLQPNGVEDPGAVGNGWTEQTAGDRIVARATDVLRGAGVEVVHEAYRRDPNFIGSTKAANAAAVDAVVAVHHDIRTAPEGSFAYHWPSSERGAALAWDIIDAIANDGRPTRPAWLGPGKGFADGPVTGRGLYILEHTRAPACLLEVGPIGHGTLDSDDELAAVGDLVAIGILEWGGIPLPAARPTVHRDVAISAVRDPDCGWARMVADAHRFAYVERDGKAWRQTYPDGRTTTVDSIDHLVGLGYQADTLVAAAGGGVAITPDTGDLTRLKAIELIRDRDVPRARPWAG